MKTNDNATRLKTYKIKNHDSGQTYRVKAVSYTDAKMKYNSYILKDSFTTRKMIKDGWSAYTFKTGLRSDAFKQYLRDRGIYFESSQDGVYTHFEVKNADEAVDRRANEIVRQLKDSITEDGYNEMQTQAKQLVEKLKIKTSLGISINEKTKVVMLFAYSVEQAERWVDKLKASGYKAELHRERGNVNVAKFIMPELKTDSLTEDADIAQNDIKSTYLPEDANADNIQYLGFNEKRKLSFYGYGDRYFVHYDLEGRTEEIDKSTVQKILKKNILGEIDENDLINKEPQSEEIVSDAFEDAGEISIEQFDPKRLVESSKSRKQALHNEIKMKNGDVYTVFFHASGKIENPSSIWVSIVLEKSNGQQERVLSEKANSYEQAIQIMNDWKKKQERGDR